MEKIINSVCNICIDNNYSSLSKSIDFKSYDQILIITDKNVYNTQMKFLKENMKETHINEYIINPGEESKTIEVYQDIINYCIEIGMTRKSLIIAFGGGVVGDLGGFVASTYMRGIDVVQIPTTLLSQVDSSVGGKTGINLGNYKNIIGTFYQPKLTYINTEALKTLPKEEFIDGMSEVIKYSIIYDYEFLDFLIKNSQNILNKDTKTIKDMVHKCISIKADIVEKDEREGNIRKILNLGHTFGHGIEKLGNISHGKSVSIGMNMAFILSHEIKNISSEYYEEFLEVCRIYELPLTYKNLKEEEILALMKSDKKNSFSKINLVIPKKRGIVEITDKINEKEILEVIKRCKNA